jgi:hypothetical protein
MENIERPKLVYTALVVSTQERPQLRDLKVVVVVFVLYYVRVSTSQK